jgi:hypothetical protein
MDLNRIKPDESVIKQVKQVHQKLKKQAAPEHFSEDGSIRLRALVEALDTPMGYNDVRLALMFINDAK